MIKKIMLLIVVSGFISNTYGQRSPSEFSYVVVPELYDFLFEEDQHQLNSMTKFLFKKYGFNAYFPSELPNVKRCDGLQAEVVGNPGFTYTKITVILKDCYGDEVFRSEEGRSKYKEYKKSYQDALRKAFNSIELLGVQQKEIVSYEDNLIKTTGDASSEVKNDMKVPEVDKNNENSNMSAGTGVKIAAAGLANLPEAKFTNYVLDGKSYLLRKTTAGYSFYEESENAPSGLLLLGVIEINEVNAVYKTMDNAEYTATFTDDGDLVVDSSGSVIRYTVQN